MITLKKSTYMIEGEFKFYPVGQGCFYGGSIKKNEEEFVIVYDCGTVSSRKFLLDSIAEFKRNFKKIDLLMISHFDEDHVNGLNELLTGITCEKVIIPYYSPITRLTLLSNYDSGDDYISFLKDPVSYLLNTDKFKINEVLIIQNEDDNNSDFIAPEPKSPTENSNFENLKLEFDLIQKEEDENFKRDIRTQEGKDYVFSEKAKYFSLPFKISISNEFWEFVFYLKNFGKPLEIINFQREIDELLNKTKDNKLSSLFDKTFIPNIKNIYRKHINGDLNYSSLSVFHGPIANENLNLFGVSIRNSFHFPINRRKSGTLLTGDSFLKKDEDYSPFYNYYSYYYIDKTLLFQVPHHGSWNNWRFFPNDLSNIPFYILNYGHKRKKHPNKYVLWDLITNSVFKNVLHNHQYQEIKYKIRIRRN